MFAHKYKVSNISVQYISFLNRSIWPLDRYYHSGPVELGVMAMKGYSILPKAGDNLSYSGCIFFVVGWGGEDSYPYAVGAF